MFKIKFENKKLISRETSSYPVSLADVELKSFYYLDNLTDTSQDSFVESFLIPTIIDDWEENTKYLLLDQQFKVYIPDLYYINSKYLEMSLGYLNLRTINSINYYPSSWNESDAKSVLDVTNYRISEELLQIPSNLIIKSEYLPLDIYDTKNNLEADISAGFASNDFTNLDPEIKDALTMQIATAIDIKMGYCDGYYNDKIETIYAKYSAYKNLISFL